jgi:nucleolar protein 58
MGKDLKKFLKKSILKKEDLAKDVLGVIDTKLGSAIKDDLGIKCVSDSRVAELFRGIRSQLSGLIEELGEGQLDAMRLGLGHSLSRYKLKFSPDKVDTMIVQAVGLLDDLDKEINTYAMRVKEWFGWHFPEMTKIVTDNLQYARVVKKMGVRANAAEMDFSDILEAEVEASMKESAVVSMGTDVAKDDVFGVQELCDQVISLMEYRASLWEYLKNRMSAIAPNLAVMVGELVGARLISHAGSLLNLAKQPASTVQILGAEKALFRALKTKHDTPKYGLIYHASLVGQAQPKNKGKISRVLAAKTALSVRVDALGDSSEPTIAIESHAKVVDRLRVLEGREITIAAGSAAARARDGSYAGASSSSASSEAAGASSASASSYNPAADMLMDDDDEEESSTRVGKRSRPSDADAAPAAARADDDDDDEDDEDAAPASKAAKKAKKAKKEKKAKKDKKSKKSA